MLTALSRPVAGAVDGVGGHRGGGPCRYSVDSSLVGIGRYTLYAELPRSGGLYQQPTSHIVALIGKVTGVEPTERGARVNHEHRQWLPDPHRRLGQCAWHSVSVAVGEQFVDSASTCTSGPYLRHGQTITTTTVPSQIGLALDAAKSSRGLAVLPKDRVASKAARGRRPGGWDPHRIASSKPLQAPPTMSKGLEDIEDIIERSAPIIDSCTIPQRDRLLAANSTRWPLRPRRPIRRCEAILATAAPTADQVTANAQRRAEPAADATISRS